jgi:hypothetical protein
MHAGPTCMHACFKPCQYTIKLSWWKPLVNSYKHAKHLLAINLIPNFIWSNTLVILPKFTNINNMLACMHACRTNMHACRLNTLSICNKVESLTFWHLWSLELRFCDFASWERGENRYLLSLEQHVHSVNPLNLASKKLCDLHMICKQLQFGVPKNEFGATCPYCKPIDFGVPKSLRSTSYCKHLQFCVPKS